MIGNEKIAVIIKQAREQPTIDYIPNNLLLFSKLVKGKIKIIPYSNKRYIVENVFCIINENEEFLPLNFIIDNQAVFGNAIFVSKENGEITGLSDTQINQIMKIYDYNIK